MAKKVHVVIDPKTGRVEFEVEGVIGGACTDITQQLVKGHIVEDEELTEDFYVPSTNPAYTDDL